jgi:cell wall-associated NlpC family hydrolase
VSAHLTRTRRRLLAVTLAVASAIPGVALLRPAAAVADGYQSQIQRLQKQIAAAERQLGTLERSAEQVSERFDAARIRLAAATATATLAEGRLAQARAALAHDRSRVDGFAVAAYTGGDLSTLSVFTDATPASFLSRLTDVAVVSRGQRAALAAMATARAEREAAAVLAAHALAVQRRVTAQLATLRDRILADAQRVSTLLSGLRSRELAVEAAARRAAIAAARAAAARAAALAAARAAAARAAALAAQQAAVTQAAGSFGNQPVVPPPVQLGSGGAAVAVHWALAEIGKPYVWGAAGPDSFDCSGLTQFVWAKAGVYLYHYTGDQWNEGVHVSRNQLQPGDLVFFYPDISHVGIYVGNGMMIDAPHTGAYVREEPVWWNVYDGAVQPQ